MYYDSMIAKLIVHGRDRARRDRAGCARRSTRFVIRGVASNIAFQSALLAHPHFVAGDFNTGFIAEQYRARLHAGGRAARRPATSWSRWRPRSTARCSQRAGRHQRPAAGPRAADRRATSSSSSSTPTGAATHTPVQRARLDGDGYAVDDRRRARRHRRSATRRCATSRVRGTLQRRAVPAQIERARACCAAASRTTARRSRRWCCRRAPPSCTR